MVDMKGNVRPRTLRIGSSDGHGHPPLDRPPRSVEFKTSRLVSGLQNRPFGLCDSFPGILPSGFPSHLSSATVAGAAPASNRLPNSPTGPKTGQHLKRLHMSIAIETSPHRLRHPHGVVTTFLRRFARRPQGRSLTSSMILPLSRGTFHCIMTGHGGNLRASDTALRVLPAYKGADWWAVGWRGLYRD
ncbi:hypothetical protein AOX55_00002939 [Sinorhizobium fredii CCBAU 25509]|nr:hypothetical protein SF83666_c27250 [Sinorhizobium fredii CCBAU 83666]AWM26188.1 hypothetical protein AOX55_00002939 [Sinorhizobium fredii CCBAU 25509]